MSLSPVRSDIVLKRSAFFWSPVSIVFMVEEARTPISWNYSRDDCRWVRRSSFTRYWNARCGKEWPCFPQWPDKRSLSWSPWLKTLFPHLNSTCFISSSAGGYLFSSFSDQVPLRSWTNTLTPSRCFRELLKRPCRRGWKPSRGSPSAARVTRSTSHSISYIRRKKSSQDSWILLAITNWSCLFPYKNAERRCLVYFSKFGVELCGRTSSHRMGTRRSSHSFGRSGMKHKPFNGLLWLIPFVENHAVCQ